jgi:hypothetical protein
MERCDPKSNPIEMNQLARARRISPPRSFPPAPLVGKISLSSVKQFTPSFIHLGLVHIVS